MRLFVLGASGGVGTRLCEQALARGHAVTAQTRTAAHLEPSERLRVAVGQPDDEGFLRQHLAGQDAAILCIGIDGTGPTTLFSDTARALIAAMEARGVRRLVAITGVGAGETRGHGGWLYNRIVFPLFTRNRYADKDRQEALIARSDLDWTLVRPAPFADRPATTPLQVVTDIPPDLQLRAITRDEVARFVLDCLERSRFVREKLFLGHP